MKYGLPESAISDIRTVFGRYPEVEQAVLYGSRAKGTFKNGSDIDIMLRGDGLTLDIVYRILDDIDDLLLPYTVDLSIFDDISDPELIGHIHRVGISFYSREEGPVPAV